MKIRADLEGVAPVAPPTPSTAPGMVPGVEAPAPAGTRAPLAPADQALSIEDIRSELKGLRLFVEEMYTYTLKDIETELAPFLEAPYFPKSKIKGRFTFEHKRVTGVPKTLTNPTTDTTYKFEPIKPGEKMFLKGGMARIFLATAPGGRRVAIKMAAVEESVKAVGVSERVNAQTRLRFVQEYLIGKMMYDAKSPIKALGAGHYRMDGKLYFYIVYEFAEEGTWHDEMERREETSEKSEGNFPEALDIIEQTLKGTGEVHDRGVIHGDIKPTNLFKDTKTGTRIGDFGLSQFVPEGEMMIDGYGAGTFAYMSEGALGVLKRASGVNLVNRKKDLFAIGCFLHELLYGELPWEKTIPPHYRTNPAEWNEWFLNWIERRRTVIKKLVRSTDPVKKYIGNLLSEGKAKSVIQNTDQALLGLYELKARLYVKKEKPDYNEAEKVWKAAAEYFEGNPVALKKIQLALVDVQRKREDVAPAVGMPAVSETHAGFGIAMTDDARLSPGKFKSKVSDKVKEQIFDEKGNIKDIIPKDFSPETVIINGQETTVVVHKIVMGRIRSQGLTPQTFIDKCIKIRDLTPEREADLRAGLAGKKFIIDAIDADDGNKSPNLYGNCQEDGYIYINTNAPVKMDTVGVSHELMHEAGIFTESPADEEQLARQDVEIMSREGILGLINTLDNTVLTPEFAPAYNAAVLAQTAVAPVTAEAPSISPELARGVRPTPIIDQARKDLDAELDSIQPTLRQMASRESKLDNNYLADEVRSIQRTTFREVEASSYALLKELPREEGAMSRVFLAKAPDGSEVVLKILAWNEDSRESSEDVLSMYQEYLMGRRLALDDFGGVPETLRAVHYKMGGKTYFGIIQKFVEGEETLEDMFRRGYEFSPEEAFDLTKQLLKIIYELHRRGIIHANLHPSNLVITGERGRLKLKVTGFSSSWHAPEGEVTINKFKPRGNPLYLPEFYLKGGIVNGTVDVHAAGLLVAMLVSRGRLSIQIRKILPSGAGSRMLTSEEYSVLKKTVGNNLRGRPSKLFPLLSQLAALSRELFLDEKEPKNASQALAAQYSLETQGYIMATNYKRADEVLDEAEGYFRSKNDAAALEIIEQMRAAGTVGAGMGQNLVTGVEGDPEQREEKITKEQREKIEEGRAFAYKKGGLGRIIGILSQPKITPKDSKELLSLFYFDTDSDRERAEKAILENINKDKRYRINSIVPALKRQREVLDNISEMTSYFEDRESTENNLKELENRRFVVFFSEEGLFSEGKVLGHSSHSTDSRVGEGSIYMHVNALAALSPKAMGIVMLHENNDAVRVGHQKDVKKDDFDTIVRSAWNGLLEIQKAYEKMGKHKSPRRQIDLIVLARKFSEKLSKKGEEVPLDEIMKEINDFIEGKDPRLFGDPGFWAYVLELLKSSETMNELKESFREFESDQEIVKHLEDNLGGKKRRILLTPDYNLETSPKKQKLERLMTKGMRGVEVWQYGSSNVPALALENKLKEAARQVRVWLRDEVNELPLRINVCCISPDDFLVVRQFLDAKENEDIKDFISIGNSETVAEKTLSGQEKGVFWKALQTMKRVSTEDPELVNKAREHVDRVKGGVVIMPTNVIFLGLVLILNEERAETLDMLKKEGSNEYEVINKAVARTREKELGLLKSRDIFHVKENLDALDIRDLPKKLAEIFADLSAGERRAFVGIIEKISRYDRMLRSVRTAL
ncbi:protein kinase [Candidatus Omnitrophota bacterium]